MTDALRKYATGAAAGVQSIERWLQRQYDLCDEGEGDDWTVNLEAADVRKLQANLNTVARFLDALGKGDLP